VLKNPFNSLIILIIIYIKDIKTENLTILEECLKYIENTLNYPFLSFTIDGRKGVIQLLERL
jgi:hypothetical protein